MTIGDKITAIIVAALLLCVGKVYAADIPPIATMMPDKPDLPIATIPEPAEIRQDAPQAVETADIPYLPHYRILPLRAMLR